MSPGMALYIDAVLEESLSECYLPLWAFAGTDGSNVLQQAAAKQIGGLFLLGEYEWRTEGREQSACEYADLENILQKEGQEHTQYSADRELVGLLESENREARESEEENAGQSGEDAGEEHTASQDGSQDQTTEQTDDREQSSPEEFAGGAASDEGQGSRTDGFVAHTVKLAYTDMEELQDYNTLLKRFYTVDKSTSVSKERLNAEKMMAADMTVSAQGEGPQILIYHTHSQEGFADSVAGDPSTTIVGVGERLAQILTEQYGYEVLHHTEEYDLPARDDAYSVALPELEKLLADNPQIQVVIDLHRDAMEEGTKLVTDLDGRPTARFMFFNGLSRTRKTGDIAYLHNENLDSNLAFSFQLQKVATEYYPGLTRKIYLKAYRYNMHLRPKNLLIELGAQNNTLEEAMNACDPLAHILHMVLSGQNKAE